MEIRDVKMEVASIGAVKDQVGLTADAIVTIIRAVVEILMRR